MRKWIILLIASRLLCEAHRAIYWLWPETAKIEYNLFLSKAFDQKITVLWYVYELTNILNNVIIYFVVFKIIGRLSNKLSMGVLVLFFGSVLQAFLYAWDRNTSIGNDILTYFYITALIIILIPDKKGKIKHI